jgi:hypothetical protein
MTDVIVEQIVSTIRAVDGDAMLHPRTMARLVQAVLTAVDEKQASERRRKDDTRIGDDDGRPAFSGGVAERG